VSFETDSIDASGAPGGGTADTQPARERRLHMLAYDYWHLLREDRAMPDFRDLTPDGLAPFRENSLLVDFGAHADDGAAEPAVRFAGGSLAEILSSQPVRAGMSVSHLETTAFGEALIKFLSAPESRVEPTEFEYQDDDLAGRGAMLPLALTEGEPAFVWVVTSFDATHKGAVGADAAPQAAAKVHQQAASEDDQRDAERNAQLGAQIDAKATAFQAQLADARDMAAAAPHMDGGGRTALYQALAAALGLYESAAVDSTAYRKLLAEAQIKPQKRAPYTPALKLVFGKNYDKTRLTEYAAALTHAVRNGVGASGLVAFLEHLQGGIKGCVLAERAIKRGEPLPDPNMPQVSALEEAMARPAISYVADATLRDSLDQDLGVLLVRKSDTGLALLGTLDIGPALLEKLIKQST